MLAKKWDEVDFLLVDKYQTFLKVYTSFGWHDQSYPKSSQDDNFAKILQNHKNGQVY